MRLSRKVLWVVLSSLFFNDIWKNCTRDKAMDVCLRVLKESSKSRFNSYSVRNNELIVSHITFRDCRAHIFSDNLSRIIEIAKFVEISHLLRKSCLLLFCFHGHCQNDLERRNSQHTRFTQVRTNIWTDDFFYLCNLFTRLHGTFQILLQIAVPFTRQKSKTCTVPRVSCKRKVDSCKFCPNINHKGLQSFVRSNIFTDPC